MPDSLPPTIIKYNNLSLTGSDGIGPNSHGVSRAINKDKNNCIKGFYKPAKLENHYPPELAKWSVAISQMYRVFMGDNAAEEQLVVYENGEIAGTFSVAAPNARPLLFANESVSDPQLNHYLNPSPETLIQLNMTQLLVTSWFMKEDDLHAGQVLFSYDSINKHGNFVNPRFIRIDFDMSCYDQTGKIKGFRILDGFWRELAEKNMRYSKDSVTYFPHLYDGPFYWPTKTGVTGHKDCKSAKSFQSLPGTKISVQLKEVIDFKTQKYESILRQLLLFQPKTIKLRLQNYLTDKTFIEKFLNYQQDNYDDFYRTTVRYRGVRIVDRNINEPSFRDFLRRRPSACRKVIEFANHVNKQYEERDLKGAFNLSEIEKKYHQIWRDAFSAEFNEISLTAAKLLENVTVLVSVSGEQKRGSTKLSKKKSEAKISSDLLQKVSLDWVERVKVSVDRSSPLKTAFKIFRDILPGLVKEITGYFNVPTAQLTLNHNAEIVKKMYEAENTLLPVLEDLGKGTETNGLLRDLLLLMCRTRVDVNLKENYKLRKLDDNKPIDCEDKNGMPEGIRLPYNDPIVIRDVLNTMFEWAKDNKEQLHLLIGEAIEKYGKSKERADPVLEYIRLSEESGENQLACIFSRGGWENSFIKTKSLNIHLFNILLRKINHTTLQPVLENLNGLYFSDSLYIQKLQKFVRSDKNLLHPYHDTTFPKFQDAMYRWADRQWDIKRNSQKSLQKINFSNKELVFEKKLNQAISDYKSSRAIGAIFFRDSSAPISQMLKAGKSYKYILSTVIKSSRMGEKSLAANLFKQIWPEIMKTDSKLKVLKYKLHAQELLEKLVEKSIAVAKRCSEKEDDKSLLAVQRKMSRINAWW